MAFFLASADIRERPAPFRSKNRNRWSVSIDPPMPFHGLPTPTSPHCDLRGLVWVSTPTSSHSSVQRARSFWAPLGSLACASACAPCGSRPRPANYTIVAAVSLSYHCRPGNGFLVGRAQRQPPVRIRLGAATIPGRRAVLALAGRSAGSRWEPLGSRLVSWKPSRRQAPLLPSCSQRPAACYLFWAVSGGHIRRYVCSSAGGKSPISPGNRRPVREAVEPAGQAVAPGIASRVSAIPPRRRFGLGWWL